MTYKVCYWDEVAKEQKERDANPEEAAEIDARKAALPSVADYESAVQETLDAKARQFGYDDIKSAVTYAGDPDATFNDQGTKLRAWRGQCWRACYSELAAVQAGSAVQPTIEQLLAILPPSPL